MELTIDSSRVRQIMEEGRFAAVGDRRDRHTFSPEHQVFYEEMSVQARPEILLKIVRLLAKDGGNRNLIWRVLPEIDETKGITYKLYMRYAFY